MANHSSSASTREATPHVTETSRTNISNALKRRAESVINNKSIDAEIRAVIRYGLEINDPWLAEMVRRANTDETIIDNMIVLHTAETSEDDPNEEKLAALAELLCRAGAEPYTKWAALLVLMAMLENATHPKALANLAKHLAFSRCGELNVCGMLDAQIAAIEDELLAHNTLAA